MRNILTLTILVALSPQIGHSDEAKPRKVPCPAVCTEAEDTDETQVCGWRDKELYKIDGIGCRRYDKVCWCKPKRAPLPPVTVL